MYEETHILNKNKIVWFGWFMVLNATFNNISVIFVMVSFIGGGNRSNRKKITDLKSLPNLTHNVVSSTPRYERALNS
jgi:hypothetical protein